jgi:hypothetical protein
MKGVTNLFSAALNSGMQVAYDLRGSRTAIVTCFPLQAAKGRTDALDMQGIICLLHYR